MQVEQAIYTSARTTRMSGYHLVARSPGITEELAVRLSLWGPTHGSLATEEGDAWALSYFPVDQNWSALARTCYGGPEYSDRGGRQVVTRFLLMTATQGSWYRHHPLRVFHTASTLGHLRLLPPTTERLPTLELPDEMPCYIAEPSRCDDPLPGWLEQTLGRISAGRSVALVGIPDPLAALNHLFAHTADEQRRQLSFSTGLKVTVRRPVRIYVLTQANPALRAQLNTMGIDCLMAETTLESCTSVQFSATR